MNRKPLSVAAPKKRQKLRVTMVAALVSLLASHPVHALPDSFPQYPLQTGFVKTVPPNVMLILDDSGSMSWTVMPVNTTWTNYQGDERYPNSPHPGYDTPEYRSYINNVIYYNPSVTYKPWRTASLPPAEDRLPPADFRGVSNHTSNLSGKLDLRGNGNTFFYIPKPGIQEPGTNFNNYHKYRIAHSNAAGNYNGGIVQRCAQLNCTVPQQWSNAINETPTGRSQQEELQNFANWFHYHSSRMKMAKAGASEAFGQLEENFRVGYDRINSRSIVYKLPIHSDDGLFEGNNRDEFFKKLQQQTASGGTPLRNALTRTGEYFTTAEPYRNSNGAELSCRKNYAVLTTDGEWNGATPKSPKAFRNLAEIGNYYWKTDLRPNLVNNVPTSAEDSADWQHMNTFGISIGAGSTLNTAPLPTGGPWPAVSTKQGKEKIDDLAWAAGEGRGKFFLANNTDEFAEALLDALSTIGERDASVSNVAASSNSLELGTLSFGISFNSKSWLSNISAFETDKNLNIEDERKWVLSETFTAGKVNGHFSQRTVLTHYGSTSARLFDSNTITDSVFKRTDGAAAVSVADNIDYLRGVQSLEKKNGGELRNRSHPFGDIIHSTPFYAPDTKTLYVGANDGMLHGLEGDTGKVLFSYIPKGINAEAMASLSLPKYEHHFLMDGNIDVSSKDIFSSGKNILLGALGRGGRGVFALDVTNPESMGVANVLWDHSTQDTTTNPNMGYVFSRIRIRPGNHDKTWAFVPNGIESPNGKAALFVYELDENGAISQTHELVAGNQTDNGLMSMGLIDLDGDSTIDLVYGGDLKGNVWRWDFRADTPGPASLLFTATNDNGAYQPITGGITAAINPDTNELMIGFGTGRLISENDLPIEGGPAMQPVQSVYGLIDPINTLSIGNTPLIERSDLQNRTIGNTNTAKINGKDRTVRSFESSGGVLDVGKKGWYMDFPPNERVISAPQIVTGATMVFPSVIPPDPNQSADCESVAGSGFINMIDLLTGTTPIGVTYSSIGMNNMPTSPQVLCNDNSCKLIACDGGNCAKHLDDIHAPSPAASPVKPHRVQWRSLR